MTTTARHDWTPDEVEALFALPFQDLLFEAQRVHREHQAPNTVQMSTLLSVKTGACPEDCAYCPQSIRYDTGLERETWATSRRAPRPRARRAPRVSAWAPPGARPRSATSR
jgi:biotin synthase